MELLHRVTGPAATNVWVLGDEASREAMAVDTATPCVGWLTEALAARGWTLKLVVSTHRHWDHIGDNAAVVAATGAQLAVHLADRDALIEPPQTLGVPFPILPSIPAIELAEGSRIRFGAISLDVLHTPGDTE
jgi:hydroxyacylglutathione hydrolase